MTEAVGNGVLSVLQGLSKSLFQKLAKEKLMCATENFQVAQSNSVSFIFTFLDSLFCQLTESIFSGSSILFPFIFINTQLK